MRWSILWQAARDVLVAVTGLAIIVYEAFVAAAPSDAILVVGMGMVVPSVASHASQLLSGPSASQDGPPPSSSPPSPLPSSSPPPDSGAAHE